MSDTTTAAKVPERWVYGGVRINVDNKRTHSWFDASGRELYYTDTGTFVIGGIYDVMVERKELDGTGKTQTIRTQPEYTGERIDDQDRRQELYLADIHAKARLSRVALERKHAKMDELEEALQPLRRFASKLKTRADRNVFIAMVIHDIEVNSFQNTYGT